MLPPLLLFVHGFPVDGVALMWRDIIIALATPTLAHDILTNVPFCMCCRARVSSVDPYLPFHVVRSWSIHPVLTLPLLPL